MHKTKTCAQCREKKPMKQFSITGNHADCRDDVCKVCRRKNAKPVRDKKKSDLIFLKQFLPV